MIRFFFGLLLSMGLLILIINAGATWGWWVMVPSFSLPIVLFSGISTGLVYYWLYRRAGTPNFTQSYLLSIVLKMLGFSIFILIVIFADREEAFDNAVIFLVSYFAFTALEVAFLYGKINSSEKAK